MAMTVQTIDVFARKKRGACSFFGRVLSFAFLPTSGETLIAMAAEETKLKKAAAAANEPTVEKKAKKEKKSTGDESFVEDNTGDVSMAEADDDVEVSPAMLIPIASPLANKPLTKKVFKTIKKASKSRGHVKRGVKEVVKGLRKGEKGVVILAGDISPMDIISHIPVLCEETSNPYVFVPSKEALGNASSTKRPTSCIMIVPGGGKKAIEKGEGKVKEDYQEEYSYLHKEAARLVRCAAYRTNLLGTTDATQLNSTQPSSRVY